MRRTTILALLCLALAACTTVGSDPSDTLAPAPPAAPSTTTAALPSPPPTESPVLAVTTTTAAPVTSTTSAPRTTTTTAAPQPVLVEPEAAPIFFSISPPTGTVIAVPQAQASVTQSFRAFGFPIGANLVSWHVHLDGTPSPCPAVGLTGNPVDLAFPLPLDETERVYTVTICGNDPNWWPIGADPWQASVTVAVVRDSA